MKTKAVKKEKEPANSCTDLACPVHGGLKVRGRMFKGYVRKKFPRRIVIEFERVVHSKKYERFSKKKTKIHARLPACKEQEVNIGDYVQVGECRPISKIIHFVYLNKVSKEKSGEKVK